MATTGADAEVVRRINFYRVDAGTDDAGRSLPFDPIPGLTHIKSLTFVPPTRYRDVGGSVITCCWPDQIGPISKVRIGTVRRSGLPQLEKRGALSPVTSDPDTGIVDQTHVVFFKDSIAGVEFNFHGPRAGRFRDYYNEKCDGITPPIYFEPLFRSDVIEQLNRMKGIRLFDLKVRASDADLVQQIDAPLGQALRSAVNAGGAEEVELVLRARRGGFLTRIDESMRNLLRSAELLEAAKRYRIVGVEEETGQHRVLDFLNDYIVARVRVLKTDYRQRAVNSESAYKAIAEAYEEVKGDIRAAHGVHV